jgi:hypothetical protein
VAASRGIAIVLAVAVVYLAVFLRSHRPNKNVYGRTPQKAVAGGAADGVWWSVGREVAEWKPGSESGELWRAA